MSSLVKLRSFKFDGLGVVVFFIFFSFLFSYIGISFFNRPMQDDLNFHYEVRTLGLSNSLSYYYNNFEGAFTAFFMVHLFAYYALELNIHMMFININLVVLFISLYLLLSEVFKKYLSCNSPKNPLYLTILIITSILYFQNDVIYEAVFWLTGSTSYMVTISFLFLGFFFLLRDGILNLIFSAMFLSVFAGVRLYYSVTEIGLLFYFLLFYYLKYRKIDIRIGTAMIFALIGFAIYLAAPGNYAGRFTAVEQNKLFNTPLDSILKQILVSFQYYFYVHFIKTSPFLILNLSLSFILGLSDRTNVISRKLFIDISRFSIYAIAINWISIAVVMAVIGFGAGPSRTFFFPLLITMILFNIYMYTLGVIWRDKLQAFSNVKYLVGLLAGIYFINFFYSDYKNLKVFSEKFDSRSVEISHAKTVLKSSDTLFLEKLPLTKTLMSNELRGEIWVEMQEYDLEVFYSTPFQIELVSSSK